MLFSVEQAFVWRDEIRALLKTPASEVTCNLPSAIFATLVVANAVLDERCTFRTGNSPQSMPVSPQSAYYTAPFLTCFVRLNHAISNSMQ